MSHQERLTAIANETRALAGAVCAIERAVRTGAVTQAITADLLGQLALDIDRAAEAVQIGADIAYAYTQMSKAFDQMHTAYNQMAMIAKGQAPAHRADFDQIEPKEHAA